MSHAILAFNRGRDADLADRIVAVAVTQPAARRRFRVITAQRRPGRYRCHQRYRQARQRHSARRPARRETGPAARALETAQRHDYLDAYVSDLPNVVDIHAIRAEGIRRRPAGRGQRRLLGPLPSGTI